MNDACFARGARLTERALATSRRSCSGGMVRRGCRPKQLCTSMSHRAAMGEDVKGEKVQGDCSAVQAAALGVNLTDRSCADDHRQAKPSRQSIDRSPWSATAKA